MSNTTLDKIHNAALLTLVVCVPALVVLIVAASQ